MINSSRARQLDDKSSRAAQRHGQQIKNSSRATQRDDKSSRASQRHGQLDDKF